MMISEAMRFWRDPDLGTLGVDMLTARNTSHRYSAHFHEEYTIATFETGAQRYKVGRKEVTPVAGNVVVMPPGEVHTGEPGMGLESWSHRAFYVDLPTMITIANAVFVGSDVSYVEFNGSKVIEDRTLSILLARCHAAIERNHDEPMGRQQAFSEAIEALLIRHGISGRPPRDAKNEHVAIARAIDCMEQRLADSELSIQQLAAAADLSPFYFMRSFRAATGMSVHRYLVQLRLALAKKKLAAGETASSTAIECGFFDQSHLIRHFKSALGVTPGHFAKAIRT